MPVRCEKVQTHLLDVQGEQTGVVIYHLSHSTSRPGIQASRGPWLLAVHFGAVLRLDSQLAADGAKCLEPLSHFAPYRIGADARKDVVAERALGLCKYLDHVLKISESPAPKALARIVDDFVATYWVGNLQRTLRLASSPALTEVTVHTMPDGKTAVSTFLGRVRPGQEMLDTPSPMPTCKEALKRFRALQAAGGSMTKGELLRAVRPLGAAPAAQARTRPFLEVVPPKEISADACPLCKRHLRQKDTGCIRLRTCGHEVHGSCFNELLTSPDRFPKTARAACPKCGERWATWVPEVSRQIDEEALLKREQLAMLLALGMTSKATWGQHLEAESGKATESGS
ncbi:unnamed protein product [Effrenium voratum]|uniref:RING-type domain-containing protein n=1 Tax=Effrenium voratum TaxID=2562239 RepID=A0AA36HYX5_9DINO|nr:unnamed protein product [Effrenium voratum]CAJ1419265.1 unnamed protein product [Effrenium voratum]